MADANGDDWIFKVDAQGQIVWSFFDSILTGPRLRDIAVLDDGSVIAIGRSFVLPEYYALRLGADGSLLWRQTYSVAPDIQSTSLEKVTVFDGAAYAVRADRLPTGCTSDCVDFSIVQFDLETGALLDEYPVPELAGQVLTKASVIKRASSGEWLVGATATSPPSLLETTVVLRLDDNFALADSWQVDYGQFPIEVEVLDLLEVSGGSIAMLVEEIAEFGNVLDVFLIAPDFSTSMRSSEALPSTNTVSEQLALDNMNRLYVLNGGGGLSSADESIRLARFNASTLARESDVIAIDSDAGFVALSFALLDDGTALVLAQDVVSQDDVDVVLRQVTTP